MHRIPKQTINELKAYCGKWEKEHMTITTVLTLTRERRWNNFTDGVWV